MSTLQCDTADLCVSLSKLCFYVLVFFCFVQNCVLAFADSCKLDLKRAGGVLGIVGGGEGFFNTTLTGPGLVVICSMNDVVFREALVAPKLYRR